MQLLKSHLTKLAQGKELFQICTEADSPGPSFLGTRHSVGVVQTCLSIQPEIPFYLVSPACSLSKKSLDSPESNTDHRFSNARLHPTLPAYPRCLMGARLRICILNVAWAILRSSSSALRTMAVTRIEQITLIIHVPGQTP